MTIYTVAFLVYSCSGGWFSKYIPSHLKPFVCDVKADSKVLESERAAWDKVQQLGPEAAPVVQRCEGTECEVLPYSWTPLPK